MKVEPELLGVIKIWGPGQSGYGKLTGRDFSCPHSHSLTSMKSWSRSLANLIFLLIALF